MERGALPGRDLLLVIKVLGVACSGVKHVPLRPMMAPLILCSLVFYKLFVPWHLDGGRCH